MAQNSNNQGENNRNMSTKGDVQQPSRSNKNFNLDDEDEIQAGSGKQNQNQKQQNTGYKAPSKGQDQNR